MTTNEELRARAETLPREQWHVGTGHYAREVRQGPAPVLGGSPSIAWVGESDEALAQAHAAYIAAASPDAILRLLDENAVLRAALQRVIDQHPFDTLKFHQVLAAEALNAADRLCR